MNLFDLAAKITLDTGDFERGITRAASVMSNAADKIMGFGDKAVNAYTAAETTVATAVGAIVKKAVDGYGAYEQLVGGVETLFGAGGQSLEEYAESIGKSVDEATDEYNRLIGAQNTIINAAAGAYKTAGMSANDYIETATSFSASLIQSLEGDTVKAAEYADMAITDMSDNANKMGSDVETLKTAYAGFSKQNYTMLDNLKLGYGGTKSEMKRLIKDAEAISGKDLNIKNYSDIIEAIHIIQTNMGITGTTAREAASTIQGSIASAKTAFDNFATGLADGNQDIGMLFDNLVESVGIAADNIAPRIVTALDTIGNVVETRSDDIAGFIGGLAVSAADQAPKFIKVTGTIINKILKNVSDNREEMAEAGLELFEGLLDSFEETLDLAIPIIETLAPTVASGSTRYTSVLFNAGVKLIMAIAGGIADNSDELADTAIEAVLGVIDTVDANLDKFLEAGETIIISIANALSENADELLVSAVSIILKLAEGLTDPERLGNLIEAAIAILLALADGLAESIPLLLESAPTIIKNLVLALTENAVMIVAAAIEIALALANGLKDPENIGLLLGAGVELIGAVINGIFSIIAGGVEIGKQIAENIKSWFTDGLSAETWGSDMIDNFINGLKKGWEKLKGVVTETAQKIKDILGFSEPKEGPLSNFHTYAPDMIDLFIKGVKDNEKRLTSQIKKTFDFGDMTIEAVKNSDYIEILGKDKAIIGNDKDKEQSIVININIDGAEYESDEELAEAIAIELQRILDRKE